MAQNDASNAFGERLGATMKGYANGVRISFKKQNVSLPENEASPDNAGMYAYMGVQNERYEYWLESEAPTSVQVRIDRDFRPKKLGMRRDQLNMDRSNDREIRFYGHGRRAPERSWKSQKRVQKQYALRKFDKPGSSGFHRLVPLGYSFYYFVSEMRDKRSLTNTKYRYQGPGAKRLRSTFELLSRSSMSNPKLRKLKWSVDDREAAVQKFGPNYPMTRLSVFDILTLDPELFLAKPHNLIPVGSTVHTFIVDGLELVFHDYEPGDL